MGYEFLEELRYEDDVRQLLLPGSISIPQTKLELSPTR